MRLRNAKGFGYVAALLARPGEEVYAGELLAVQRATSHGDDPASGNLGDAGPLLDDKAGAEYRARLAELRDQLAEAEANNDAGRSTAARTEIEFLMRELSNAFGLGGRQRRAGSTQERVRLTVTKAIKATLKKIEQNHPPMGRLLARTIRTGTFCSYAPDPDTPVDWKL